MQDTQIRLAADSQIDLEKLAVLNYANIRHACGDASFGENLRICGY